MKKLITASLIGLLSLMIQSISVADEASASAAEEPTPASEESSSSPSSTPSVETETSTTTAEADTPVVTAEAMIPVETTEIETPAPDQPEILGEAVELYSLRGENEVDKNSLLFPNRRTMAVDGGIDVSFDDQPPMIPHSVDKDRISLQENTCLKCHSRVDAKIQNAPKPPSSHFKKRDGTRSKKVVAGRYFCTQCHASQANTQPLIKNLFKN